MTLLEELDRVRAALITEHQDKLTRFDQARSLIVGLVQDPPKIPNRITPTVPSVRSFVSARRRTAAAPVARRSPAPTDDKKTVSDLIRETFSHFAEPFSHFEVIELLHKRYPERDADITHSAVSCALNRMRSNGELLNAGERKGLSGKPVTLNKPA
jgi:hypothetical protein